MKNFLLKIRDRIVYYQNRLKKRIRILYKSAKYRLTEDRGKRSKAAYLALSVGTVLLAFVMVLVNLGMFRLIGKNLFGRESYERISGASAAAFSVPLPRTLRVSLYTSCRTEGKERAPLPEERTASEAQDQVKTLWSKTLGYLAGDGKTLKTGENVDRILKNTRYTVKLRDFYDADETARLALWSAQAYYTAADGRVYCLSAELDSRTSDVYSVTVALFDNLDGTDRASDFFPMLDELGESQQIAENAIVTPVSGGTSTVLTLSDGTKLTRYTEPGVQIQLTLE